MVTEISNLSDGDADAAMCLYGGKDVGSTTEVVSLGVFQ